MNHLQERPDVMWPDQRSNSNGRKNNGGDNLLAILALVGSGLSMVVACAALVVALMAGREPAKEEPAPPPEPVAEAAADTLTYRDREIPIWEDVPVNSYSMACFGTGDNGWRMYRDGQHQARIGVDVSAYQGEIDWEKVADSGVEFAMIRCGYRGYSKGVIVPDKNFEQNIQGALDAGLEVGVYFFSQAMNTWEAREEAEFTLECIEGYDVTYPVAFDWETIAGSSDARTNGMKASEITNCAGVFCDVVAEAGYDPVIYFNQDLGYLGYELDVLKDYTFWLAEYNETPSFYYHFDLWQYTHKGSVPGIEGDVDMNLDFRVS